MAGGALQFRVAGILNLQVRPAPDRLCEQVPRCADIDFQVTRLRFCDIATPQARVDSRRARFAQQQNGAEYPNPVCRHSSAVRRVAVRPCPWAIRSVTS